MANSLIVHDMIPNLSLVDKRNIQSISIDAIELIPKIKTDLLTAITAINNFKRPADLMYSPY